MATFDVKIIGDHKRPIRVQYGTKDVIGVNLGADPIIAEALKGWEEGGSVDGAVIQVEVSVVAPEVAEEPIVHEVVDVVADKPTPKRRKRKA